MGGDGSAESRAPVRLRGVIIPAAWDEQGRTVRVALATHDEREIGILPDRLGREALERVRREVEITGILKQAPRGGLLEILEIREIGPASIRREGPD